MITAIVGTNASGKTALVKSLLGDAKVVIDTGAYKITRGNGLVAFGAYHDFKKMGGADTESKNFTAKLDHFLRVYRAEDLLLEGMLLFSTPNLVRMKGVCEDVRVIVLTATYEEILKRLYLRNNRTAKRYKGVAARMVDCSKVKGHCEDLGIECLEIDTTAFSMGEVYTVARKFLG